jgi:hypothetical protein
LVQNYPTAGLPLSAPPAEAGATAQPAPGEFFKGRVARDIFHSLSQQCNFLRFLLQVFLHKSSFQMGKIYEQNVFFVFCFDSFGLQIALKDSLFLLGVQFNV